VTVEQRASAEYNVFLNADDAPMDRAEIVAACRDAHALLCSPTERIDADLVAALPAALRVIATFSAGTDHIDLQAARARGIVVTNTPDVLTEATADIAMLLILGACRGVFAAQKTLRQGRWHRWSPTAFIGKEIRGARLGLVGMGRIAQATARRASAFGMQVQYWSRRPVCLSSDLASLKREPDLDRLFATSDIISLHVPGVPETDRLVDGRRIALMPKGAVLVNTARGTLVDDDALIAALDSGHIFAAGLDVFRNEPAFDPRYAERDDCYLLPHIGSATDVTRDAMGMRALDNLDAVFRNGQPLDAVG
jgi:lactate dehydrogenase-like 2-hydroxyacid dehydrogenase